MFRYNCFRNVSASYEFNTVGKGVCYEQPSIAQNIFPGTSGEDKLALEGMHIANDSL